MQFFTLECPQCHVGSVINLEPGILGEYRSGMTTTPANVELRKDVQATVGRQNLTHFVCGPTRAVCLRMEHGELKVAALR